MSNHNHCRLSSFTREADTITCAQCHELLDAYVEAVFAKVDVRFHYPTIWRHLQTCESCAAHYAALHMLLDEPGPTPLPPYALPQPDLSFLQLSQPHPPAEVKHPWRVYLRSPLLGEPFLLRFSFAPAYLQRLSTAFSPPPSDADGALENGSPVCLLLLKSIPLGKQTMTIKIMALFTPEQADFVQLQATLTSSLPLPESLQATLQWGALSRLCNVSSTGEVDLGPAPLAALQLAANGDEAVFAIVFTERPRIRRKTSYQPKWAKRTPHAYLPVRPQIVAFL